MNKMGGATYLILSGSRRRRGEFGYCYSKPKPFNRFEKLLLALSIVGAIAGPAMYGTGLYRAYQTRDEAEKTALVQPQVRYALALNDGIESIAKAKDDLSGGIKNSGPHPFKSLEHIKDVKQDLSRLGIGGQYISNLSGIEDKINEIAYTKYNTARKEDFASVIPDLGRVASEMELEFGEITQSSPMIQEFKEAQDWSGKITPYAVGSFFVGLVGLLCLVMKKL